MTRRTLMVLVTAAVAPLTARAQDIDADTFTLSGSSFDDAGTLQLVHPHIGNPGSFYAGLGVVYSHEPLVWRLDDGTREVLVTRQSLYMIHPLATPTDAADAYTVHRVVLDPYPPELPPTIVAEEEASP